MARKKRRPKPAPEPPAAPASGGRWRFFLAVSLFFCVVSLVTGLSITTAWPGAESGTLATIVGSDWWASLLPAGTDPDRASLFLVPRLISAGALLLAAAVTFYFGRELLGRAATQLGLLAAAASLYLPFLGKVATPDAATLLGAVGFLLTYLLHTHGRRGMLPVAAAFLLVAALSNDRAAALLFVTLLGGRALGWLGAERAGRAELLLALPLLAGVLANHLLPTRGVNYADLGPGLLSHLKWSFLGLAPLAGWLLAGLRDLVYRLRRGDALGRTYLLGLLGGLGSPLFPLLLALLAGKQMQLYFGGGGRYPWADFVKTGQVLHLIAAFGLTFVALAGGAVNFPGAGFSAVLGMAAAYWIFSLLGVIGLFGERRAFALGGALLAGLLATLFFWVQVYPYVEAQRNWPQRLVRRLPADVRAAGLAPTDPADVALSPALPYLRRAGIDPVPTGAYRLASRPAGDTTGTRGAVVVPGRVILERRDFTVVPR